MDELGPMKNRHRHRSHHSSQRRIATSIFHVLDCGLILFVSVGAKTMGLTLELVLYVVDVLGIGRFGNEMSFVGSIIQESEGSAVLLESVDNVSNVDRCLVGLLATEDGSLIGSELVVVGTGHGAAREKSS